MTTNYTDYNSQDTTFYLNLSYYVTKSRLVGVEKHPWQHFKYYKVTCAGEQFNVKVEEPIESGIEYCTVEINYQGRHMFRKNIRDVNDFFDAVGRTLTVLA